MTSIPSRMCWVNQPTLPMGYQFCSRSPLTPPSLEPAGLAQAEFARPGPGRAPNRDFSFPCYISSATLTMIIVRLVEMIIVRLVEPLGDWPKDVRDRALLLMGFAGAFRRSELVAFDVADITEIAAPPAASQCLCRRRSAPRSTPASMRRGSRKRSPTAAASGAA